MTAKSFILETVSNALILLSWKVVPQIMSQTTIYKLQMKRKRQIIKAPIWPGFKNDNLNRCQIKALYSILVFRRKTTVIIKHKKHLANQSGNNDYQ